MSRFLKDELKKIPITNVSENDIKIFKSKLKTEMRKMGANEFQLLLIKDSAIKNAIMNHREPKDLAWALLQ